MSREGEYEDIPTTRGRIFAPVPKNKICHFFQAKGITTFHHDGWAPDGEPYMLIISDTQMPELEAGILEATLSMS